MAGIASKLYALLPPALQNAAVSLYGFYWQRRRFGGVFQKELLAFRERNTFTQAEWRAYQTKELRKLLIHAFENVPFYREKYIKAGLSLTDLANFQLEDLGKLPFLEKEELRQFGTSSLMAGKVDRGTFYSSSGSTGTPTKIYFGMEFHQRWSAAFEVRIREWAGLTRHMARGMIGGRRILPEAQTQAPFYRYNRVEKQTYFSAYHIAKKTAPDYLEGMIKNKVEYMNGYAMSNYFLASMFHELGLKAPRLKAVVTSSEKLTPEMRKMFEMVYGCKTYDSYSGVEACGLISENEFGQLLVSPDVGIMEFLDASGKPVAPGEAGEIVSTGLLNYDQPLIRYRIGDTAILAKDQKNRCGRNMPVVEEILGRVEDKVVGPDGREMVRFHGLYVDVPFLLAAQLVQDSLTSFTINVVVEDGFSENEEQIIKRRLISQLGEVDCRFVKWPEIPKNKNGKFQAVISKIK